jgi:hypothetical protein
MFFKKRYYVISEFLYRAVKIIILVENAIKSR